MGRKESSVEREKEKAQQDEKTKKISVFMLLGRRRFTVDSFILAFN
jgi:hypothetical protein